MLKARITIILRKREQIQIQAVQTIIQENLSLQAPSFQPPENVSSSNIEYLYVFLSYSCKILMAMY